MMKGTPMVATFETKAFKLPEYFRVIALEYVYMILNRRYEATGYQFTLKEEDAMEEYRHHLHNETAEFLQAKAWEAEQLKHYLDERDWAGKRLAFYELGWPDPDDAKNPLTLAEADAAMAKFLQRWERSAKKIKNSKPITIRLAAQAIGSSKSQVLKTLAWQGYAAKYNLKKCKWPTPTKATSLNVKILYVPDGKTKRPDVLAEEAELRDLLLKEQLADAKRDKRRPKIKK
jgi:hypothetical protein